MNKIIADHLARPACSTSVNPRPIKCGTIWKANGNPYALVDNPRALSRQASQDPERAVPARTLAARAVRRAQVGARVGAAPDGHIQRVPSQHDVPPRWHSLTADIGNLVSFLKTPIRGR